MTQPPNIREVDCCANCEYGYIEWRENDVDCDKYAEFMKLHNICDDFKREEL